ncbi:hypothetical protein Sango_1736100 [Sesamum angolense]|uniref:Uncharacterized protein n=1 Tax=Sesamum angolense TaxID=2727404 RepID=A0AAE1WMK0_9LAMI|nr:hypothetical protein Sango_1736100 [Sesamum angolense]
MNLCLHFNKYPVVLEGFCDVNWVTDNDEVSSTSGYVFTSGGGVISWKSTKQTCIALEFIALELAGQEGINKENYPRDFKSDGAEALGMMKYGHDHIQMLRSMSCIRYGDRLKVLIVGVLPVYLASVHLDLCDEIFIVPALCPYLYDLAFDLDYHDLCLKEVLLELLGSTFPSMDGISLQRTLELLLLNSRPKGACAFSLAFYAFLPSKYPSPMKCILMSLPSQSAITLRITGKNISFVDNIQVEYCIVWMQGLDHGPCPSANDFSNTFISFLWLLESPLLPSNVERYCPKGVPDPLLSTS